MTLTKPKSALPASHISGLWQWSLSLFIAINTFSAWNMIILDCDETFNYLEPLHFLIFGEGLQTWEYSPKFALRSYSFLLCFALPARLFILLTGTNNKILVYKFIRGLMGLASAFAQSALIQASNETFGPIVASYTTIAMTVSTGMFISATAFLPNTFSMILLTYALACWLRGHDNKLIVTLSLTAILGWPYALIIGILPALISLKKFVRVKGTNEPIRARELPVKIQVELKLRSLIMGVSISAFYLLIPSLLIEHYYYGKWIFPSLNALIYNLGPSNSGGGPELFGTEPWYYYMMNLALNFSVFLPAALASCPLAMIMGRNNKLKEKLLLWVILISSMVIFSSQQHKEERFLFVIYPLICLNAGIFLADFSQILFLGKLVGLVFGSGVTISILRTVGVIKFYEAPQELFQSLVISNGFLAEGIICMGNSWYRFPSSFYLAKGYRLGFTKEQFDGLLPIYYDKIQGTRSAHPEFNNLNRAISAQFVLRSIIS